MGADARLLNEIARFRATLARSLPGGLTHFMLFGSRATGAARADSDVDLLVVSPAFRDLSYLKRARLVRQEWDLPYPVDVLCYTPEEFATLREQTSIVKVALDEGVTV